MLFVLPDITEQPYISIFSPKYHTSRPPKSKNRLEFGAKLQAVEFF
jgi:hypothetical protein